MKNLTFIPTAEKVEVKDYPYGFKLRTTLFDTMEFHPTKGYRHVTQTINPKNGRLNNPKKSTYYPFIIRYKNEDGHIRIKTIDFNVEFTKLNDVAEQVADIWDNLSKDEKEYMIITFRKFLKIATIASIQYTGIPEDAIVPEYNKIVKHTNEFANFGEKKIKGEVKKVITSFNVDENFFLNMPKIDNEVIKKATPKDYNPFKLTSHTTI